jgi:NAD(P)H dehydrogenase (quinone)
MRVLIVYAHPYRKSLSHAALEQVHKGFADAGHFVKILDLYAEKFDPILVVNEFQRRRDLIHDPYTEPYRSMIEEADQLVFVYPVWWQSLPAILKGFFDRVFVSGFAYSYSGKKPGSIFPNGLLKGKAAWCIYTLDTPMIPALLDPGWLVVKYSIFRYCGIRRVKRSYLASVKRTDHSTRVRWLQSIYKRALHMR